MLFVPLFDGVTDGVSVPVLETVAVVDFVEDRLPVFVGVTDGVAAKNNGGTSREGEQRGQARARWKGASARAHAERRWEPQRSSAGVWPVAPQQSASRSNWPSKRRHRRSGQPHPPDKKNARVLEAVRVVDGDGDFVVLAEPVRDGV